MLSEINPVSLLTGKPRPLPHIATLVISDKSCKKHAEMHPKLVSKILARWTMLNALVSAKMLHSAHNKRTGAATKH